MVSELCSKIFFPCSFGFHVSRNEKKNNHIYIE